MTHQPSLVITQEAVAALSGAVRFRRAALGLSLRAAAAEAEVHHTVLRRVEQGQAARGKTLEHLMRWALGQ